MSTRWQQLTGDRTAEQYAEQVAATAAEAEAPYGEADLVERLVPPGARVLDAGCGTGRVAVRLAERGYDVTGVDVDREMLGVARRTDAPVTWVERDLSCLGEAVEGPFEVVLLAGNVVPLVAEGTLVDVVSGLGALLARSGTLVAGFGLDDDHLPDGCPVTPFEEYAEACAAAGLELRQRRATWDASETRTAPGADDGYVVTVHGVAGQDAP